VRLALLGVAADHGSLRWLCAEHLDQPDDRSDKGEARQQPNGRPSA
jgi:hypothetical protein